MSDQTIAALVGIAAYLAVRVIDYVLPRGRRFTGLDRWTVESEDHDTDSDQDTPIG